MTDSLATALDKGLTTVEETIADLRADNERLRIENEALLRELAIAHLTAEGK